MKLALAQLNSTVGDLEGNLSLIRAAAERARSQAADLLVVPEMAVCGYPPKDLLLREGFVAACDQKVQELASGQSGGPAVIVGHPTHWNLPQNRIANAASVLYGGRVVATVHKALLPNYDVFDERRYFLPAAHLAPVELGGKRLGIHICEDAWWGDPTTFHHDEPRAVPDPLAELAAAGVDVLINLSASPFEIAKPGRRMALFNRQVERHRVPFVFVNQVGGNDDLVFDGQSLVLDAQGDRIAQLAAFDSDYQLVDLEAEHSPLPEISQLRPAALLDALTLGLRDYMRKCRFTDCVFGLSGGIDSALACYIAARAVGPEHVHPLLMPSRYSSEHSVTDARKLAEVLGIDYEIVSIDEIHSAFESAAVIGDELTGDPAGLANQNVQARIRGALVMVRSNHNGWLALATGNKSELAVGYCTLYGDMAGGFAVLADVLKRDVYAIARYINETVEKREVIPQSILEKLPSAELAPDQFDQDSLPPYDVLDAILEGLVEQHASVASLSQWFPESTVRWVAGRLDRNEFKRRQMPPGIKLTQRAFGTGRRMPIAARFDSG